jgi:hypothetical protein
VLTNKYLRLALTNIEVADYIILYGVYIRLFIVHFLYMFLNFRGFRFPCYSLIIKNFIKNELIFWLILHGKVLITKDVLARRGWTRLIYIYIYIFSNLETIDHLLYFVL